MIARTTTTRQGPRRQPPAPQDNGNGRRPVGRPTKYRPEMCQQIIDLMAEGRSVIAAAVAMELNPDTVWRWAKEKPEFSDALTIARARCQAWWEEHGRKNLTAPSYQTGLWMANMNNRFGWSSSRQKTELTGPNGQPIEHIHAHLHRVTVESMPPADQAQLWRLVESAATEPKQIEAEPTS